MSAPGFAVLYRWRLKEGQEAAFEEAWARVTLALRRERGALGSRLHALEGGWWAAYAQWPDQAHWEASARKGSVDAEASRVMQAAILESEPPLELPVVRDLLALDA